MAEQDAIPGVASYQPREPIFLEAIRYHGDNGRDVEAFACGAFDVHPDTGIGRLWNRHRAKIQRVPPGWWVIRGVTGDYFARSAEDFAATYQPVAAAQADADQALADRMAAMEETIRAGERERIAQLAEAGDVMVWVDDDGSGIAPGVPFADLIRKGPGRG